MIKYNKNGVDYIEFLGIDAARAAEITMVTLGILDTPDQTLIEVYTKIIDFVNTLENENEKALVIFTLGSYIGVGTYKSFLLALAEKQKEQQLTEMFMNFGFNGNEPMN